MLIKALEQITKISTDNNINSANYFEGINYINDLYKFISRLKLVISDDKDISFIPTFKGKYTCEKYNIPSTELENTMKLLAIRTTIFFEDEMGRNDLHEKVGPICKDIRIENDVVKFILL